MIDRQIVSYCMSESPLKFHISNNDYVSKFTFAQLSQKNITSEQLYLWSAPIDIAECYQFYLNQLSTSNHLLVQFNTDYFYNCSFERFGPMCQYEFEYDYSKSPSIRDIIRDLHSRLSIMSLNMTCYIHLQCNRGSSHACLDWTEICDGNFDEEHCWQLEMNECHDDEFQCSNGQCIPKSFAGIQDWIPDCLDMSDTLRLEDISYFHINAVDELQHDIQCLLKPLTSSCVQSRQSLLAEIMFSIENDLLDDDCRLAIQCFLGIPKSKQDVCDKFCKNIRCIEIIEDTCPEMFYMPNLPLLFGDMYVAFRKDEMKILPERQYCSFYLCRKFSRSDDYLIDEKRILFNTFDPIQFF